MDKNPAFAIVRGDTGLNNRQEAEQLQPTDRVYKVDELSPSFLVILPLEFRWSNSCTCIT
jgi:hypothetical protein